METSAGGWLVVFGCAEEPFGAITHQIGQLIELEREPEVARQVGLSGEVAADLGLAFG